MTKAIWATYTSSSHAAFNMQTIDQCLDDNEATEIIVDPVDVIPHGYLEQSLRKVISKVRHGGLLILSGTSFPLFCKAYLTKAYDRKTFGETLQNCSNLYELREVENIVRESGFNIESIHYEGLKFIIKAGRP